MIDYVVRPGDTLISIAQAFSIAPALLQSMNPELADVSDFSIVGQVIRIPYIFMRRMIEVNGYAFPNIDSQVLLDTLPYLTYLSLFSYQVLSDGSLVGIDDTPLIQTARQAKVAPMMVITNIEESGFSGDLAHTILTDIQIQQTLINNVINLMKSKNYYGLNVDFEYIYPVDRGAFSRFLQICTDRLRPLGYILSVSVAPKVSDQQRGVQYDAFDYPTIGGIADQVIILTYEWGHTFGPPLAVSPIDQVRHVLDYAVSVIPSPNILMGMPNYGYDWTLPYQAYTAARTLSFTEAEELAVSKDAEIRFDVASQASYFNYVDEMGIRHVVWFDNEMGIRSRLELVRTYNLGGVSFWTVNSFSPASYQTINTMFDVRKVLSI